ncbi:uncharacterized protein LOC132300459 isoform X2 [Cornus florida]|uniref:uncharacterized protein LOC132300459 isoform X2 n=1 Tax=Cornus florida TaxID=4283 RepID=UPI0028A2A6D7|nr:uncharacterized protein LOC132300459 isoform X2 [Cornus florida]
MRLRRRTNQNLMEMEKGSDSVRERKSESGDEFGEMEGPSERNSEVRETSDREIVSCSSPSKTDSNAPPSDDCCPICFGDFTVPCRAQCGHWYCAGCILQYWNHGAVLQPCKCPMCSRPINKLTTVISMHHRQEEGVTEVLENIWKYNYLFVGGIHGLIHKVLVLPLIIKRMFRDMMDPDRPLRHLHKARIIAITLGVLYGFCSSDFLHIGSRNAVDFFDSCAYALVFILYLVGLCRRRRRVQHVRQLAAIQQP